VKDYILIEVKYTKEENYVVSGLNQVLHYLYDLRNASGKFFASNLGMGYNAAVITYKLPESAEKTGKLDNQQLRVKLLDFDDLKDFASLKLFLERCLENHNT
jgi:Holliday junction resolvase